MKIYYYSAIPNIAIYSNLYVPVNNNVCYGYRVSSLCTGSSISPFYSHFKILTQYSFLRTFIGGLKVFLGQLVQKWQSTKIWNAKNIKKHLFYYVYHGKTFLFLYFEWRNDIFEPFNQGKSYICKTFERLIDAIFNSV